jgi:hypothetical protein
VLCALIHSTSLSPCVLPPSRSGGRRHPHRRCPCSPVLLLLFRPLFPAETIYLCTLCNPYGSLPDATQAIPFPHRSGSNPFLTPVHLDPPPKGLYANPQAHHSAHHLQTAKSRRRVSALLGVLGLIDFSTVHIYHPNCRSLFPGCQLGFSISCQTSITSSPISAAHSSSQPLRYFSPEFFRCPIVGADRPVSQRRVILQFPRLYLFLFVALIRSDTAVCTFSAPSLCAITGLHG